MVQSSKHVVKVYYLHGGEPVEDCASRKNTSHGCASSSIYVAKLSISFTVSTREVSGRTFLGENITAPKSLFTTTTTEVQAAA